MSKDSTKHSQHGTFDSKHSQWREDKDTAESLPAGPTNEPATDDGDDDVEPFPLDDVAHVENPDKTPR